MDRTLTYDEAVALLEEYARVMRSRDERIRLAYRAHLNKTEISRFAGIDRGVVIRALGAEDGGED